MNKDTKTKEFLEYISNPLSKESIDLLFVSNNIIYDRCVLYSDFIQSLILIIFDTYMGDDITTNENKLKHFNWSWKHNIENFKKEGIIFNENMELYDYFLTFMFEVFYDLNDKDNNTNVNKNILKLWLSLFNFNGTKSRSDVDTFIVVYKLLNDSLEKN